MYNTKPKRLAFLGILVAAVAAAQQESPYSNPIDVFQQQGMAAAIIHPEPAYPPIATQLKLKGLVVMSVFVDKEGKVVDTVAQLGNPVLVASVEKALRQWKFRPFKDDEGKLTYAKVVLQFDMHPPGN